MCAIHGLTRPGSMIILTLLCCYCRWRITCWTQATLCDATMWWHPLFRDCAVTDLRHPSTCWLKHAANLNSTLVPCCSGTVSFLVSRRPPFARGVMRHIKPSWNVSLMFEPASVAGANVVTFIPSSSRAIRRADAQSQRGRPGEEDIRTRVHDFEQNEDVGLCSRRWQQDCERRCTEAHQKLGALVAAAKHGGATWRAGREDVKRILPDTAIHEQMAT